MGARLADGMLLGRSHVTKGASGWMPGQDTWAESELTLAHPGQTPNLCFLAAKSRWKNPRIWSQTWYRDFIYSVLNGNG